MKDTPRASARRVEVRDGPLRPEVAVQRVVVRRGPRAGAAWPRAVEAMIQPPLYSLLCMENHEWNRLSCVRMTLPPMASAALVDHRELCVEVRDQLGALAVAMGGSRGIQTPPSIFQS